MTPRSCRSRFPCSGFIALIFLFTIAPSIGWGQTNALATAPLPPAAQEALHKGIIAAKVPDYLLAIRYFAEARKIAPDAPAIFLNLGLAESRIPGRELRAMAWFGAYLAAFPDAPNTAAVKEQIDVLEVRNQSNVSRLIKSVQDAASQLSEKDNLRGSGLVDTVIMWVDSGDIAEAQKAARLIHFENDKSIALRRIAEAKFKAGDLAGAKIAFLSARKSAELIDTETSFSLFSPPSVKNRSLQGLARIQASAGDVAGAQETADLIHGSSWDKIHAQLGIAVAQAKAGDISGAQISFTSSLKTANADERKALLLAEIAGYQLDAGDIAGAQNTLAEAQKAAEQRIQEKYIWEAIAKTQAKLVIVSAAGSHQTMPTAQSGSPTVVAAADWLKTLDDDDQTHNCPLNAEPFLDLAGYLKSLRSSEDPYRMFEGLKKIAEKLVTAQNVITGMLKQQGKR